MKNSNKNADRIFNNLNILKEKSKLINEYTKIANCKSVESKKRILEIKEKLSSLNSDYNK